MLYITVGFLESVYKWPQKAANRIFPGLPVLRKSLQLCRYCSECCKYLGEMFVPLTLAKGEILFAIFYRRLRSRIRCVRRHQWRNIWGRRNFGKFFPPHRTIKTLQHGRCPVGTLSRDLRSRVGRQDTAIVDIGRSISVSDRWWQWVRKKSTGGGEILFLVYWRQKIG